MGGGYVLERVAVVVEVVDNQTLLAGVLVSADLAQHLGRLARKHRAQDELDVSCFVHNKYRSNYFKIQNKSHFNRPLFIRDCVYIIKIE